METGRTHKWDILLIGGVLLLAAILYLTFSFGQEEGAGVRVCVDGKEIASYSLQQDGTYSLNGGTNTLVIEDGAAWVSEADCPDDLCVKQGKIRSGGQCITCLPNKLTVTVYGADSTVDLVS